MFVSNFWKWDCRILWHRLHNSVLFLGLCSIHPLFCLCKFDHGSLFQWALIIFIINLNFNWAFSVFCHLPLAYLSDLLTFSYIIQSTLLTILWFPKCMILFPIYILLNAQPLLYRLTFMWAHFPRLLQMSTSLWWISWNSQTKLGSPLIPKLLMIHLGWLKKHFVNFLNLHYLRKKGNAIFYFQIPKIWSGT